MDFPGKLSGHLRMKTPESGNACSRTSHLRVQAIFAVIAALQFMIIGRTLKPSLVLFALVEFVHVILLPKPRRAGIAPAPDFTELGNQHYLLFRSRLDTAFASLLFRRVTVHAAAASVFPHANHTVNEFFVQKTFNPRCNLNLAP